MSHIPITSSTLTKNLLSKIPPDRSSTRPSIEEQFETWRREQGFTSNPSGKSTSQTTPKKQSFKQSTKPTERLESHDSLRRESEDSTTSRQRQSTNQHAKKQPGKSPKTETLSSGDSFSRRKVSPSHDESPLLQVTSPLQERTRLSIEDQFESWRGEQGFTRNFSVNTHTDTVQRKPQQVDTPPKSTTLVNPKRKKKEDSDDEVETRQSVRKPHTTKKQSSKPIIKQQESLRRKPHDLTTSLSRQSTSQHAKTRTVKALETDTSSEGSDLDSGFPLSFSHPQPIHTKTLTPKIDITSKRPSIEAQFESWRKTQSRPSDTRSESESVPFSFQPKTHGVTTTVLKKKKEVDSRLNISQPLLELGDEVPFQELFGKKLNQITINQNGNNTCYLLASLDSILHLPQHQAANLLGRIKIHKNGNTYQVLFPGQRGTRSEVITVTEAELAKRGSGARSSALGIRIIEQACLKIPNIRAGRFDESANALTAIFGAGKLATVSIQNSKEVSGANIEGEYEWLNAGYDLQPGGSFESDDRTLLVTKSVDGTLQVIQGDGCTETKPGKGTLKTVTSRDKHLVLRVDEARDGTIKAVHRRKLHEGEHHIGEHLIDHDDREPQFKNFIANIADHPDANVLTAIRIGSQSSEQRINSLGKKLGGSYKAPTGGHYYSIRGYNARTNKIVLADPFNTASPFEVPFKAFMKEYNIEGMQIDLG